MKLHGWLLFLVLAARAFAGVEEDWQQILALDAGPKAAWKDRAEARAATLAYFDRQEKALRDFAANHPADPRCFDARLRLVHLLATRADFTGSAEPARAASQMLDELARDAPPEKQADVAFAKLALFMRHVRPADENARAALFNKAQTFAKTFPADRRLAALFAEVATLYDPLPRQKKELLETALAHSPGEELRRRIEDDLRRIAFLGQPVPLAFTSTRGAAINVEKLRGKVVLIYFFADWSPLSIGALDVVRDIASSYPADAVQTLGLSLDENPAALEALLRTHKINWPIFCDGQGWRGPLVRSLGINALPTFWILDRGGRLRTLNAREEAPALIEQLLREKE